MPTIITVRRDVGLNKEIGINSTETISALPIKNSSPNPQTTEPKYNQNVRLWIYAPIRVDLLLEFELLALTFATGIEDATTFSDFFCYTSNQTGNTVSLALGIAGVFPGNFYVSNAAFSLGLFIVGCWIMGQTGNIVGSTRRLWVLISSLIQTVMVFAAATLMNSVPVNLDQPFGPAIWSVLALLAFSGGGQVAMARGVRIPEISTANASLAYVDFLVDPNLLAKHNRSRNRRVSFLFMLAAGCFLGAYGREKYNTSITLMMAGIVKLLVTVAFAFNKSEDSSPAARSYMMPA